jgi:DNA-binding transcriptional regulator YdaS (Cro superfamily)
MTQSVESNQRSGIAEALTRIGSQTELARLLGISQQAISVWVRRGWVPAERAREIEYHTGVARQSLIKPQLRQLLNIPDG